MKKTMQAVASAMVVLALVASALTHPATIAIAQTAETQPDLPLESGIDTELDLDLDLDFDVESVLSDLADGFDQAAAESNHNAVTVSSSSFTECVIEASSNVVNFGANVTLDWKTTGFDTITINGEAVSGSSGSLLIEDLRETSTFVLQALSNSGSSCVAEVLVTCLPPDPTECKLEVLKEVDRATAKPGDTLTYTVTVKNTGDADCTGGGVRIEDVVDDRVSYQSHQLTSNLSAGYGNYPVYTSGDRTLRFNAHVLTPGESGTITWMGTVNTPAQCGDFIVYNKAQATAKELNNFRDWVYSQQVKTAIDYDCTTPECVPGGQHYDPEGDLTGYIFNGDKGTVTNSSEYCSYDVGLAAYEKFDDIIDNQQLFDYDLGVVGPKSDITLMADVPNCAYQIDLFYGDLLTSLDGQRYGERLLDAAHLNSHLGYCGVPAPTCDSFTASPSAIMVGDSTTLTWETTNATEVTINNNIGTVAADGSRSVSPTTDTTYVLTAKGAGGQTVDCSVPVTVSKVPVPTCDIFEADPNPILRGASTTLTWATTNATEAYINNGIGQVDLDGSVSVKPLADIVYTLTLMGQKDQTVECQVPVKVTQPAVPSCDLFVANPSAIMVGASTTLTWETSNATMVSLNHNIGVVAASGTREVAPTVNTTYELTVTGAGGQTVSCTAPVTVSVDPIPVCESFTATPNSLPVGGGTVTLDWLVRDAVTVSIAPTIGSVGLSGSTSTVVTQSTTYTLTAVDANNDEVQCVAPVAVADPEPVLTCADNVTFSASDTSITRGTSVTLNWSTTDVDTVSISGINATSLSGSQSVAPSDDITYVLTATRGNQSVDCPVSITVSSGGGGGGGSSSPRCELDISDTKIKLGDEITLTWDTTRAREVTLSDSHGETLFSTDDMLTSEKDEYFDGSITLRPTRDTEYTLLVERGSRDRECRVEVELDDSVTVLQTRDQQPLVAGISLSQVPHTGFEAGPVLTMLFYFLLVLWALFITYLLVIRRRHATPQGDSANAPVVFASKEKEQLEKSEQVQPEVFVESITPAPATHVAPSNLPTGTAAVGYDAVTEAAEVAVDPHQASDATVTELENRAHSQRALLSSDAVRHFVGTTSGELERHEALDAVLAEAKKTYPLEDGWIVINESRMQNLCAACQVHTAEKKAEPFVPATVPEGTGSLAEAIVTGNVVAAYEMIGHRPMFALADAAADLDAVYRKRQGDASATVSELLLDETKELSDEKIKAAIAALTGALDGTYPDEEAAVKIAIMKAVKAVA